MLTAPSTTLPRDTARRHRRLLRFVQRNPTLAGGGWLFVLMVVIAIAAPYGGTDDPQELNPIARLRPPSAEHWFGTDMLGRDLYSRTLYGSRISLLVGLCMATLSMTIGLLVGLVSGYLRHIDTVVMRVMDSIMAIPAILLAVALMALVNAGV